MQVSSVFCSHFRPVIFNDFHLWHCHPTLCHVVVSSFRSCHALPSIGLECFEDQNRRLCKAISDRRRHGHLDPFGNINAIWSHGQKRCKRFKRLQRLHDKPSQFCDVSPPPPYSELPWKVNGEERNRKRWETGGTKRTCSASGPDTGLQKVMMRNALRQNQRIIE